MTTLIANILMHSGGGPLTGFEVKIFLLIAGTGILVAICWGAIEDWFEHVHGRNWPTSRSGSLVAE